MTMSDADFKDHLDLSRLDGWSVTWAFYDKRMPCVFAGNGVGFNFRFESQTWEEMLALLPEWAKKGVGGG